MDSFTYLIYTHDEYSDILDIHLKRLQQHWPSAPLSLCSNRVAGIREKYPGHTFQGLYEYDDSKPYGERIRSVLAQMKESYVLVNHEHNIFVAPVSDAVIVNIVDSMQKQNLDQVRMIVSGIGAPVFPLESPTLTENRGPYFMSCMTTLWKRTTYLDIATRFADHSFRCFECEPIQAYVSRFRNFYLSSSLDQQFTGEGHFLSYYFPTAHVTGTGKWRTNTPMNRRFIEEIQDQYGIDLSKRGTL